MSAGDTVQSFISTLGVEGTTRSFTRALTGMVFHGEQWEQRMGSGAYEQVRLWRYSLKAEAFQWQPPGGEFWHRSPEALETLVHSKWVKREPLLTWSEALVAVREYKNVVRDGVVLGTIEDKLLQWSDGDGWGSAGVSLDVIGLDGWRVETAEEYEKRISPPPPVVEGEPYA